MLGVRQCEMAGSSDRGLGAKPPASKSRAIAHLFVRSFLSLQVKDLLLEIYDFVFLGLH